jgi:Lsr2
VAQKVNVLLVDDIDGSDAEETVRFGIDGAGYEIDLNGEHAEDLRAILTRYAKAGRKVTGTGGRAARARSGASAGGSSKTVRDWAKEHGYEVNDRGRVPAHVMAEYEAAGGA